MFGLIKDKKRWNFAAIGKHPVAGDYLSLGAVTPVLGGFSSWMEKGYSLLSPQDRSPGSLLWKFWAKGPNGTLICGILKNSTDKHGRPYPLMLAGEGRLPDVTKEWDLIPFACEKTWQILESLANKNPEDIRDFKRILSKLKGPPQGLLRWRKKREDARQRAIPLVHSGVTSDFMNKMNSVDGLSRRDRFSLWLDVGAPDQVMVPISKFLILMRMRAKQGPGTVFIGGATKVKRLVFVRRSLMMDDFYDLWATRHPEEDQ